MKRIRISIWAALFSALAAVASNTLLAQPFIANEGISGSWYEPATGGQGFIFELLPAQGNTLVVYWFTYEPSGFSGKAQGDHFWLVGTGKLINNSVALAFSLVTGGEFDDPQSVSEQIGWASGSLQFESCDSATLSYNVPATKEREKASGAIALTKLTSDTLCANGGVLPPSNEWAGDYSGEWFNDTFQVAGGALAEVAYDSQAGTYDVTMTQLDTGPAPIVSTFENLDPNDFMVAGPVTVTDTTSGDECSVEVHHNPLTIDMDCPTAGPFGQGMGFVISASPAGIAMDYDVISNGSVFAVGTILMSRE